MRWGLTEFGITQNVDGEEMEVLSYVRTFKEIEAAIERGIALAYGTITVARAWADLSALHADDRSVV